MSSESITPEPVSSGLATAKPADALEVPDDLVRRVIDVIAKTQHLPLESVTIDKTFQDLKIDSLDGMNILFAVESEFNINIPDDQATQIRSVREMVEGIAGLLAPK